MLSIINRTYYPSIPIDEINSILIDNRVWLVQENGSPWSGMSFDDSGMIYIDVANEKGIFQNTMLYVSWSKMNNGNYEVNTYLI